MKIAPRAAEAFLASPDRHIRASLFYGPDTGLSRLRARRLIQTLLGQNFDPMALAELTESKLLADPALLADELSAISLMAPKRVIWVADAGDKLSKIIESAAACFSDSVFLIVTADELPARSALRGYFEKENNCAAIASYKDKVRDVQDVIRKAFAAAGVGTDRATMDYLAGQLGNDRGVTQQELDKIIAFAGEERSLTLEEARQLVDYNRDTDADDVVNAAADRNVQALETMLGRLMREGTPPVQYLRALQRYFNRLYYIRSQMTTGQSADQVISGLRPPVFFRQLPLLARHVQQWNIEQIVKALNVLVAAELACKTSDLPPLPASSRRLFQLTQVR